MKKIKIILPLTVFLALAFFATVAKAESVALYISPANLTKTVGDNLELSVRVSASASKVYAVEGNVVFQNLSCKSIVVADGVTPQATPTCSSPYFLVGLPLGVTTDKVLFTISALAESAGQASVSFTGVDIIGEGVSLSKASNAGDYTINAKVVVPVAPKPVTPTPTPTPTPSVIKPTTPTTPTTTEATSTQLITEVTSESQAAAAVFATSVSKRSTPRILIVVVVLVILIGGAYLMLNRKKKL